MKRLLIVVTVLLLAIVVNAAEERTIPGNSTTGKEKAVIEEPIPVDNITELIKIIKKAETDKNPIPAANVTEVIKLLKKAEVEKKAIPVSNIAELAKRLKKVENGLAEKKNAYEKMMIHIRKDPKSLLIFCLIIIAMGGCGGFAGGLYNNKCKHIPAIDGWKDILVFIMSGVVCAFGVIILFSYAGVILNDNNTELSTGLYLIGISLMSGFFAMRLLPRLGDQLQKKLDDLGKKTDKEINKVEKEVSKVEEYSMTYITLLSLASTALSTNNERDRANAIKEIEENIELFPIDRPLHIYLGRLYRWQEKLDNAISLLRRFVKKRLQRENSEGLNSGDKEALATAFFNISCYHCLKAENHKKGSPERKRLLGEALVALKEVEEYNFDLAKEAFIDSDMILLKETESDYFEQYNKGI